MRTDGKVRCRLCSIYSPHEYRGNWVQTASFSGHKNHPIHINSIKRQQEEQALAAGSAHVLQEFAIPKDVFMGIPDAPCHIPETSATAEDDMWASWNGMIELDPGPEDLYEQERLAFNRKLMESQIWGETDRPSEEDDTHIEKILNNDKMRDIEQMWDENEQNDILSEILESSGMSKPLLPRVLTGLLNLKQGYDDVEDEIGLQTDSSSSSWFPYSSKLSFLLDTVDNLPRLRISSSQMKVILWLLHEVGVKGVPSFSSLRKMQKALKDERVVPTIHLKSPKGNTFSFNDPRAMIANVSLSMNIGNCKM